MLSRSSVSSSPLILLIETRHNNVDPSAFGIHFSLNASPLSIISGRSMDSQNGMLSFQSIISDVTIPSVAEFDFEGLSRFILDFFLFGVFDSKESKISPEDPFHFLVLECFLLWAAVIFNVVVKMLVVGCDELCVFTLFAWCHTLVNFEIIYFWNVNYRFQQRLQLINYLNDFS